MQNRNNPSLESLLKLLNKNQSNEKHLHQLKSQLNDEQKNSIQNIMNDRDSLISLLNSPQALALLKKLNNRKQGELMDNIGDIIKNLSDEDIKNLEAMAEDFFGDNNRSDNEKGTPDNPFSNISPDVLLKLSNVMGMMNKSDSRCDLIEALKPNLSIQRLKRADEAMQFIKLLDILPLIEKLN